MAFDISHVGVDIGAASILRDVSLRIGDRERVGLVGASGSGKSVLAMSVMGLMPANVTLRGSAMLDGQELIGASASALAGLRGSSVGFVFQDATTSLSPVVPIGKQIEAPLRHHYDLTAADRAARVAAMLSKVGVSPQLVTAYPHELSGGQQQRVAIACALVTSPRLIIADEPTTALDAVTQAQIVDLMVSLVDDAGASLLFITHDFSVLSRVAQTSYVLADGGIAESGPTGELLARPRTPAAQRLVYAARELRLNSGDGGEVTS